MELGLGELRVRLRSKVEGRPARSGQQTKNTRLPRPELAAPCRYVDQLDYTNLAVSVQLVADAAILARTLWLGSVAASKYMNACTLYLYYLYTWLTWERAHVILMVVCPLFDCVQSIT